MARKSSGPVRSVPSSTSTHESHRGSSTGNTTRGPVRTSPKATRTTGGGGGTPRHNRKNGSERGIRTGNRHDIKL